MSLERNGYGARKVEWTGTQESAPLHFAPGSAWALELPAGFTSSTVTFTAQGRDGDYKAVYEEGVLVSVGVEPGAINVLPPNLFPVPGKIKIVAANNETAVGYLFEKQ